MRRYFLYYGNFAVDIVKGIGADAACGGSVGDELQLTFMLDDLADVYGRIEGDVELGALVGTKPWVG